MSMEQIPAKEFMRRLASIDHSLTDIAKSLGTLTKIANRQYPGQTISHEQRTPEISETVPWEEDDDEY